MLLEALIWFWIIYWPLSILFTEKAKDELFKCRGNYPVVIDQLLTNMVLTFIFGFYNEHIFEKMNYLDPNLFISKDLIQVAVRFILTLLVTEVWFYHAHRFLHLPSMYPYHKTHHLFIKPKAVAAVYCSHFEMIFVNYMSVVLGPMLTGMKLYELVAWATIVAIDVISGHSGYEGKYIGGTDHDATNMCTVDEKCSMFSYNSANKLMFYLDPNQALVQSPTIDTYIRQVKINRN